MKKDRSVKQRLFSAILVLVMLFTSLLGTTFAWFTDQVSSAGNQIVSGTLKVDLSVKGEDGRWVSLKQNSDQPIFNYKHWEPGYTRVEQLKVDNLGTLALKYQLSIEVALGTADIGENNAKLSDVIDVYVADGEKTAGSFADITAANGWKHKGTLTEAMEKPSEFVKGQLNADGKENDNAIVTIALHMQESAGNEYQNLSAGDIFVNLIATQATVESDSFGTDYDDKAEFPEIDIDDLAIEVEVENGLVKTTKSASRAGISITVPAGVMVDGVTNGTATLVLSVDEKAESEANVTLDDDEILQPLDVHVEGVSAQNKKAIVITIKKAMPTGLNMGNYKLYHVENGATNVMTSVDAAGVDAHNEFYYDPATGDTTLGLATFSEVAVVANTVNAWNGEFDYEWYDAEATELVIANADQLAAFGAIVGGMAEGIEQDGFKDKTVKLIADVNIGDLNSENGIVFYPIGYNSDDGKYEKTSVAVSTGFYSFMGTFDGNGHTVSNFYQNTWEMKGDHDWYDATLQYYRDGMGLFGKVYGGTVKNLTVKNFSSDGEIATTGVIAAYADGATFENIAIFDCNPRVYNIGNGGIVGCVGWYAKEAGLKTTFTNITVDNSNKISALWGSYDVACGGIVGQYYPTSGQSSAGTPKNAGVHFENCHVSATMDVYNDVCANYQYYAYRYTGMLIGSVRENLPADANGHVYPKMDGITASDCTVHFGTWNDYYYCEIIDNTTASYTHDYQMSRLTEIKALDGTTITYLDGTTGTVPASGRANYVIVDYTKGHGTENATCYHFKDGAVWNHEDAGYHNGENGEKYIDENGDGKADLKEDKQHIYLEFNNLVTGYGWGVTSKGVGEWTGVDILDKTMDGSSVEKFKGELDALTTDREYTLDEIFTYIEECGVKVVDGAVNVTITNLDENGNVIATFTRGEKWNEGKISFENTGNIAITIQDYYFCEATTIEVTITDRQPEEKFDIVMNNGDFLHRVGNSGTVALDKLFKAKDGVTVGTVSVTVEAVNGTAASGTYTSNATWTNGTIQFSGTGVVKVTITDNDYCTPTELILEVVDATNVTVKTDAKGKNIVLLNDISGGFTVSNGYALYGNGFKATCSGDGSYRSAAVSYGFVTVENGGILDNVQIICDVFPESYLYTNEMTAGSDGRYPYGYSAVVISGNSTISNCYIYGARNNIQIGEGNVIIENTVLECGSLSNIHIKSSGAYTVTLDDVTTIQYQTTSKYDSSKKVLGFGILVGTNESESNPTIKLTGDLKQYNWVTNADTTVSNTYAKTAITEALKITDYQHTINNTTTVNMGIAYLNEQVATIEDERENKNTVPYSLQTITMSGQTGQVCSVTKSGVTANSRFNAETDGVIPYTPSAQKVIAPSVSHSEVDGSSLTINTVYNNAWITTFTADLDYITGGSYNFKFSDLVVRKYGKDLTFTVKDSSGNAVDTSTEIKLNQLFTDEYTLIVTDNAIYNSDGNLSGKTVTHELPFVLYATKTSIDPPKFTNAGTATAIRLVSSAGGDWRPAYTALTGVSVTYWSASESKVKTVDLSTLYNSGTISSNVWTYTCDDYTLTITGGAVHTDGTTITPVVANNTLYFASTNKAFGTGTTSRNIILTYVFTDKNASTTWNRTETVTYSELDEYDYNSFKDNGTLAEAEAGGCFVEGTLITMADGTQKAVEDLVIGDMVMIFNHVTGKYEAMPIIFNTHSDQTEAKNYDVLYLQFDDGRELKIVESHGLFDTTLMQYVYIDYDNYQDYIGHEFYALNNDGTSGEKIALTNAFIKNECVRIFCPVTYFHMNSFANGFLNTPNIPGGITGLVNYFEYDEDLKYNEEKMQADIEKYGLYTYDDFDEYISEEAFNSSPSVYLKVAVGKGMITYEQIVDVIQYLLAGSLID